MYVMPEYVLAISATLPVFETWKFEPPFGILDSKKAHGTVVTLHGGIEAE